MGDSIGADSGGDGILIEDDVVGETGVVSPGNGVTLGDGNSGRVEDQSTCKYRNKKHNIFNQRGAGEDKI